MTYSYSYFISFSSSDLPYANALDRLLSSKCRSCWIDRNSIEPSTHYPTAISRGIEKSRQMIVLLSRNSLNSGWVNSEIWSHLAHDPGNEEGRVIPVTLNKIELPPMLSQIQTIDATGGITEEVIASILSVPRVVNQACFAN